MSTEPNPRGTARVAARERRLHRALLAAWWSNLAIWAALLAFLGLSLGLAYLPLGVWNLPVGLAIAAIKAALVVAFFMNMRRANALTLLTGAAAFLFIFAMFLLTFNDLLTRV